MIGPALFVASGVAKEEVNKLALLTNNLVNANTPGFRRDFEATQTYKTKAGVQGLDYSQKGKVYSIFKAGPVVQTGRDLDVAIAKEGFIAIQTKTGKEAYTRAGNFQIKNNLLTTGGDDLVLGRGGVINIPSNVERISIGEDGTISAKIKGEPNPVAINQIKLTNPPLDKLTKNPEGSFSLVEGASAPIDNNIKLISGSLEGSNVSPVETLTELVELSRGFEMQMNLMKNIETNSSKANEILEIPR